MKLTVGTTVPFIPFSVSDPRPDTSQPLAALVSYVWNPGLVNLTVFNQDGTTFAVTSVPVFPGNDPKKAGGYYVYIPAATPTPTP
jgi:hypothetical protein